MSHLYRGFALLALLASTGCGRVRGSCDRRATAEVCEEITSANIKDSASYKCTSSATATERGTWSTKACDRTGAIAACETNLSREWYYPGRLTKVEEVAFLCGSSTLLDAKGKVLKGIVAEKPPESKPRDPELTKLVTGTPSLEAVVSAIEKLKFPSSGSAATIRPSGGKHVTAAAFVYEEDLTSFTDPKAAYRKDMPAKNGDDLRACGAAVRAKDRRGMTDADLERVLTWCGSLTHLLVLRMSHFERPESHSGSEFKGGKADGYVVAYELPSGKTIGGFSFKAESSKRVKSDEMQADFRWNIEKAIQTAFVKADPGATLKLELEGSRD